MQHQNKLIQNKKQKNLIYLVKKNFFFVMLKLWNGVRPVIAKLVG